MPDPLIYMNQSIDG